MILYTSKPQAQLLHAGVGGAGCGVHYFEFAEKWFSSGLLYI